MSKWLLGFALVLSIQGSLTYVDKLNNFSMDYPRDWKELSTPNGVAFLRPKEDTTDKFQENVNLLIQDLSDQPMTLEQFNAYNKKQLNDNIGASANLSIQPATLAGQNAEIAYWNMTYQGIPLKIEQYWFVKGKKAYVFTYTAQPAKFIKYENIAIRLIKSFRFN
jgi:serine/threonine-protein kinase